MTHLIEFQILAHFEALHIILDSFKNDSQLQSPNYGSTHFVIKIAKACKELSCDNFCYS